jgi:hypothetical protein
MFTYKDACSRWNMDGGLQSSVVEGMVSLVLRKDVVE